MNLKKKKKMKVTKHKRLYCYTQEKWLPKADKFDNFQDKKLRYVISDHILEEENQYEAAKKQNISIWQFFENNWFSPNFASVNDVVTEEVNIACHGYHGLYHLLPFIDSDVVLEFNFSVEFETEECGSYDEDECKEVEPIEDPDFTAKQQFWAVNRYDDILMGWKDDKPYWEIDDGYVKWDVGDRGAAAFVDRNSPIYPLFPRSEFDDHGAEKPYKVTVRVDGRYLHQHYDSETGKFILK